MKINLGVAGEFQPFAVRLDDEGNEISRRELAPLQSNLITNTGLDYLNNGTMYWQAVHIGTGSRTPANDDTRLASWLAATRATYQSFDYTGCDLAEMQSGANPWGAITMYYRFDPGQAVGNITELGLAIYGNANEDLFTRALIKDEAGNPTAISVQPGEYLYIAYTLRCYVVGADSPDSSFEFNGATIPVRVGLARCTEAGGNKIGRHLTQYALPRSSNFADRSNHRNASSAWSSDPAVARTQGDRSSSGSPAVSYSTYVSGSYTLDTTMTWGPTSGNGTWYGIQYDTGFMNYRIQFLTPITKTSDYTLTFTVRQSWGRYTP